MVNWDEKVQVISVEKNWNVYKSKLWNLAGICILSEGKSLLLVTPYITYLIIAAKKRRCKQESREEEEKRKFSMESYFMRIRNSWNEVWNYQIGKLNWADIAKVIKDYNFFLGILAM